MSAAAGHKEEEGREKRAMGRPCLGRGARHGTGVKRRVGHVEGGDACDDNGHAHKRRPARDATPMPLFTPRSHS